MVAAKRLTDYLDENHVVYDTFFHPYSEGAFNTARSACISSQAMVKAVVLRDEQGLVLAALPASNKLMLGWVNGQLDRRLRLIGEYSVLRRFDDCEPGAIPAIGEPWGMHTIYDSTLDTMTDIYLESGDHRELIHMYRDEYQRLTSEQPHGTISCPQEEQDAYLSTMIPGFG